EVQTDNDTFLRYADQPMVAFVMFFSQRRSAVANKDMELLTQQFIDAFLQSGGRYYLPYRLHASQDEFWAVYFQVGNWFHRKHKYDPDNLFENELYLKYADPN